MEWRIRWTRNRGRNSVSIPLLFILILWLFLSPFSLSPFSYSLFYFSQNRISILTTEEAQPQTNQVSHASVFRGNITNTFFSFHLFFFWMLMILWLCCMRFVDCWIISFFGGSQCGEIIVSWYIFWY